MSIDSSAQTVSRATVARPVINEHWTQVEELPDGDDSDYSGEEVEYITLDLGSDFPQDLLRQANSFQLTALNTDQPWVRVGPHIYRGRHEQLLGSDLILEQPPSDPDSVKQAMLRPVATTQARVAFEPVSLLPKDGNTRQTASSFLLPKGAAAINAAIAKERGRGKRGRPTGSAGGRGSRGRGRGRGRGKGADTQLNERQGSVAESTATGDDSLNDTVDDAGTVEGEDTLQPAFANDPAVEEF